MAILITAVILLVIADGGLGLAWLFTEPVVVNPKALGMLLLWNATVLFFVLRVFLKGWTSE